MFVDGVVDILVFRKMASSDFFACSDFFVKVSYYNSVPVNLLQLVSISSTIYTPLLMAVNTSASFSRKLP